MGGGGRQTLRDCSWWRKLYRLAGSAAVSAESGKGGRRGEVQHPKCQSRYGITIMKIQFCL